MSDQDVNRTIRRVYSSMDDGQFGALDELLAPDYAVHFPGAPGPMNRDEAKQFFQGFYDAFPDLRHTVEETIVEGDRAACRLSIRGTHLGPFQGLPATGRNLSLTSMNFFRFVDGRIVEHRAELDATGMMLQLGFVLAPGQAAEPVA